MRFILDNSVAMRWLFKNGKRHDVEYAFKVLSSLDHSEVLVPDLWHLEVINVLVLAVEDGLLTEAESQTFLNSLGQMPIVVDTATAKFAFANILQLARRYHLSAYDAAYLELALREQAPLATLDTDLRKGALGAGVSLVESWRR